MINLKKAIIPMALALMSLIPIVAEASATYTKYGINYSYSSLLLYGQGYTGVSSSYGAWSRTKLENGNNGYVYENVYSGTGWSQTSTYGPNLYWFGCWHSGGDRKEDLAVQYTSKGY